MDTSLLDEKATFSTRIALEDASQVGEARRAVTRLTRRLGFAEVDAGRASLVAVEAATNICKHAGTGEMIITPRWASGPGPCLEIAALDSGPGMEDVERNFADGFSSAGTSGTGLGAVTRQADTFDIYSRVGRGTALWAAVCRRDGEKAPLPPRMEVGAVNLAKPGEPVSGDAWSMLDLGPRQVALVVDGLGHGPDACRAALAVVQVLEEHPYEGPAALLRRCHEEVQKTRGAAAAAVEIDFDAGELRFAGVGNVRAMVAGRPPARSLPSTNGTVGHQLRRVDEFHYPWEPGSLLIMATDGITSGLDLRDFPGLQSRSPGLMAAVLSRAFRRNTDDSLLLVARERLEGA